MTQKTTIRLNWFTWFYNLNNFHNPVDILLSEVFMTIYIPYPLFKNDLRLSTQITTITKNELSITGQLHSAQGESYSPTYSSLQSNPTAQIPSLFLP